MRVPIAEATVFPATHRRWSSASPASPRTIFLKGRRSIHLCPQGWRHERKSPPSCMPSAGLSTLSGTQIIRTAAILQLLLGNVGRAGGRPSTPFAVTPTFRGATDMGGVFDTLPGYLKVPNPTDVDLAAWLKTHHADRLQARSLGFLQLLLEHAKVLPSLI